MNLTQGTVVLLMSSKEAAKKFPDMYGPEDDFPEEKVILSGPPENGMIIGFADPNVYADYFDDGLREFPVQLIKEIVKTP